MDSCLVCEPACAGGLLETFLTSRGAVDSHTAKSSSGAVNGRSGATSGGAVRRPEYRSTLMPRRSGTCMRAKTRAVSAGIARAGEPADRRPWSTNASGTLIAAG